MSPPRMLLLDVFGTLLQPRKPDSCESKAELSRSYGLQEVTDSDMKSGLKRGMLYTGLTPSKQADFSFIAVAAFKELNKELPLYGKKSGKTPEDWWTLLIERTLTYADVAGSDLHTTLPLLAPAILKQFESKAGYILADDALPLLQSLKQVSMPPLLGLCSNSDRRIMGPLRDLGVFEFIAQENLLTSWDIESSKPDPLIFRAAVELLGKDQVKPQDCLFVGDDYAEDCVGALQAGLQAGLVQRSEKAHPNVSKAESNPNVRMFTTLEEVARLWLQ